MQNLYELNPRQLWVKYSIALGVVLLLIIGSHFIHLSVISESAKDARIVNVAGQQRMLSQRIALKSEHLFFSRTASELLKTKTLLESAIDQFELNHNWLLTNAIISDAANLMYFSDDNANIDYLTKQYIAQSRKALSIQDKEELSGAIERLSDLESAALLKKLDNAVTLFTSESELKIERLEFFQLISLLVAVMTILAEALLIFLPAQRGIINALDLIAVQNCDTKKRNRDLVTLSEALTFELNYDSLTELKNRRAVREELNVRIQGFETGSQLFVLMIDLDDFKEVNDTFGYPVGDSVLKYVADVIKSKCRETDTVARIGGDEFVVLIETSGLLGDMRIQRLSEDIVSHLQKPFVLHGNEIKLGASIGYSVVEELPIDGAKLISNADIALRNSKKLGKGLASSYRVEMRLALEERSKLLVDIVRAIEANEFVAYLQPQVSLKDGHIIGFEVLGRWNHPSRGILPPAQFIPIAEEIGIIDQIDKLIAISGLDALANMRAEGYKIPKVSINMSARSLRKSNFCSELTESLTQFGLEPSDILIEVLETTLIEKSGDQAISSVTELSQA